MEAAFENLKRQDSVTTRIEALKVLTKLLLHEVEALDGFSPATQPEKLNGNINLTNQVQKYETHLICNALVSVKGNQREAAKMLGMKYTTLNAKIKRYEIDALVMTGKFSDDEIM